MPADARCVDRSFEGLPADRVSVVEEGTRDFAVIGPRQSKDLPIGLKLTENGQPIGGLRFTFFLHNSLFKIQSVIDATCRPVEDYANAAAAGTDRCSRTGTR